MKTTQPPAPALKIALRPSAHVNWPWPVLALLLALPLLARAQSYAIDRSVIAGGGGTSTNDGYALTGTIGQLATGGLQGGNYTLDGGFWGVAVAIQTPGAPLLSITNTGTNRVVISWPMPATGFVLERAATLGGSPSAWAQVTGDYQTNALNLFVLEPLTGGQQFYRLRRP